MAITPSYKVNKEGEEEYIDRPAVMTPQVNPEVDAKYQAGKAQAYAADYVEWPTKIHATDEGY
jgi:hypothetical protein